MNILRSLLVGGMFVSAAISAMAQGGPPPEHGPNSVDMKTIHALAKVNKQIKRTVTNLPNGIEAITESSDPAVAKQIQAHVAAMKYRLDNNYPIRRWDPLFAAIFENVDKFTVEITNTAKGVKIRETSEDAYAVKLLQAHAKAVNGFVHDGMPGLPKPHPVPAREKSVPQLDYSRTVDRSVADVIAALPEVVTAQGFRVVGTHDVTASFKAAGIERGPFVVVEVCNPKIAAKVLQADPRFGSLIPCRLAVFEQGGKTVVSTILPTRLASLLRNKEVEEAAKQVDSVMIQIIDNIALKEGNSK